MYKLVKHRQIIAFVTDSNAEVIEEIRNSTRDSPALMLACPMLDDLAILGFVQYEDTPFDLTGTHCYVWATRALRRTYLIPALPQEYATPVQACAKVVPKSDEYSWLASCKTTNNKEKGTVMPEAGTPTEETQDMFRIDLDNVSITKDGVTLGTAIITANMPPDMLDKYIGIMREGFAVTQQLLAFGKPSCKCEHGNESKHP